MVVSGMNKPLSAVEKAYHAEFAAWLRKRLANPKLHDLQYDLGPGLLALAVEAEALAAS